MNKPVGERDWSAQEVSQLLLNLPLQQGSRQVLSVDCRKEEDQPQMVEVNADEVVPAGRTAMTKYRTRDMARFMRLAASS